MTSPEEIHELRALAESTAHCSHWSATDTERRAELTLRLIAERDALAAEVEEERDHCVELADKGATVAVQLLDAVRSLTAECDQLRREKDALAAQLEEMRAACGAFAEHHGPSADHHRDECPGEPYMGEHAKPPCDACAMDERMERALAKGTR